MPFLAYQNPDNGEYVIPEEVTDGETVYCPTCEGRMRPRGGGDRRARHFMHIDNIGEENENKCRGISIGAGESDYHRKLKSIAVSGLRARFENHDIAYCGPEYEIEVSAGPSLVEKRRADAILQFEDPLTNPNQFFGAGIVIEVQHHNESKDGAAVTADYLQAGYSVYWAHKADFTDDRFRIDRFDRAFNERWPNAFAPYFTDADNVITTVKSVKFDPKQLRHTDWSFLDPRPDCDHALHTGHRGDPYCLNCGTDIKRHDRTGRRMYRSL